MDQSSFPRAAGTLLRHDMRPDRTGWTVCDAIEGRPICLGGVALVGLSYEDASEMTDALNRQDLEIGCSRGLAEAHKTVEQGCVVGVDMARSRSDDKLSCLVVTH